MTGFPRRWRTRNASMPKLVFALTVLLLALGMPAPSSARSTNVRSLSGSSPPQKSSVAVDMFHYHHFKSPFAQPNLTLSGRMKMLVKSSRARAQFLAGKISRERGLVETAKVATSPISSNPYIYNYLMEISLGTPSRTLLVVADTGSSVMWVQCTDCLDSSCYDQPDALFDPQASSTYNTIPCADPVCVNNGGEYTACSTSTNTCYYGVGYGDNSTTIGILSNETLTLNGTDGFPKIFNSYTFGCGINQSTATPFNGSDGLVGLGRGNLSLVFQLGSKINNTFSYCLVNIGSAVNKTSPLLLGSVGNLSLTYTPILSNPSNPDFYYLDIIGITVNGVPLDYPNDTFEIDSSGEGGIIIDSGTSFTHLVAGAYNPFVERLRSLIKYPSLVVPELDLCYNVSNVTNPVFPDVVMQFKDVDLALPASNLFLAVDDPGAIFCLLLTSAEGLTFSILGNVQQQDFQIAYDLTNNRIGFAPTTC